MERKEFLKLGILGSLSFVIIGSLNSCDNTNSNEPTTIDFTIDLTQPEYQVLNTVGGSIIKQNVLIFRDIDDNIKAVSSKCTHENATLEFSSQESKIICPKHNSEFDTSGKVLKGPAKKNLYVYKVERNGNIVRIFS